MRDETGSCLTASVFTVGCFDVDDTFERQTVAGFTVFSFRDVVGGNCGHGDFKECVPDLRENRPTQLGATVMGVWPGLDHALLPDGGGGVAGLDATGAERSGNSLFDSPHFPIDVELAVFRSGPRRSRDDRHIDFAVDDRGLGDDVWTDRSARRRLDAALSFVGGFCNGSQWRAVAHERRHFTPMISPCGSFPQRRLPA